MLLLASLGAPVRGTIRGVFCATLLLITACSNGSDTPEATPDPALEGLSFLLASDKGLTEVSDGRERQLVTVEPGAYILDPIISRDGREIAYVVQTPAIVTPGGGVDFGSDLYVAARDGSNQRLVLKHKTVAEFVRTPAWRQDGTLLTTIRGRDAVTGDFDLHIARLDPKTGATTRFAEDAIDPVLAPDGQSLLLLEIDPLTQNERLVLSDPALSRRIPLAGTANQLVLISSAVFSPDGTKIAFAATDIAITTEPSFPGVQPHPFAQDIWIVNRDGSNLHRLSELADNQPSIDWADGTSIYALGATGFWRIDASTGEREQVGYPASLGQIRWLR